MNKQRRNSIQTAINFLYEMQDKLDQVKAICEESSEEEQEYFDNMPENLQGSDKGLAAESAAENLQEVAEAIDVDTWIAQLESAAEGE